jgi:hypothetical protein
MPAPPRAGGSIAGTDARLCQAMLCSPAST